MLEALVFMVKNTIDAVLYVIVGELEKIAQSNDSAILNIEHFMIDQLILSQNRTN